MKALDEIDFLALAHFKEGKSRQQIAICIKADRSSVGKWVRNFLDHGLYQLH